MKYCHNNKGAITIEHYTHSGELPNDWDGFVPDGHFLQRNQLAVTEATSLPDLSFIYLLLKQGNQPVFAAGFQLLQLKSRHINRQMIKAWQHTIWQTYTGIVRPKLLVGGHLFRHDVSSIYYNNDAAPYDVYTCYIKAIDKAMEVSCASAVVIKDMPEILGNYFRNYEPQYITLRNDISMEMEIPADWKDIKDYEAALKHKYAQRFRKIRQPWPQQDIRELDADEVERSKDTLYALYQQVTDHQQVRIGFLSPDFLPVLKRHDDRLKIWGMYDQGVMIAFFSAWQYEDVFDMFYIGFDYEMNKAYNLYFNILYFAVEQAIASGKGKLIMGRTALDAKARLGCKPKYLSTFLYIKNGMVRQRIMQLQKSTTEMEGAWESKHPLKG